MTPSYVSGREAPALRSQRHRTRCRMPSGVHQAAETHLYDSGTPVHSGRRAIQHGASAHRFRHGYVTIPLCLGRRLNNALAGNRRGGRSDSQHSVPHVLTPQCNSLTKSQVAVTQHQRQRFKPVGGPGKHQQFGMVEVATLALGRMSQVPWNFGGGPVSIRLRSPRYCARRARQVRRFHVRELLGVTIGGGDR